MPICTVGIGVPSADLEGLSELVRALPAGTGMAFVVVFHDPPADPHRLAADLGAATAMPVLVVGEPTRLAPGTLYVGARPGLVYADGGLVFCDLASPRASKPIDALLRSLALARRSRAVGVLLRGGDGGDGALGIQAVREAGGISLAQEAGALAAGDVDVLRSPAGLGAELGEIARRLQAATGRRAEAETGLGDEEDLRRIYTLLRSARDVDFSLYRQTTLRRRVLRRMVLNKVPSLGEYLELLHERPAEVEALFQDILIKVTHFFRDPEVFETLKRLLLPALLKGRRADASLRVWVPACSTGEEVYSLAIALTEVLGELRTRVPFQIFATDLSEAALEVARRGVYIENIAMDVSPERLRRFFVRVGRHYQIAKPIREACIFARQNVTCDPPFSRLDLVSCRNLLIYLDPVLQKKVIPVLHYALRPTGYLVLGASETVGGFTELFSIMDKKSKIYAKAATPARADGGNGQAGTNGSGSANGVPEVARARPRAGTGEVVHGAAGPPAPRVPRASLSTFAEGEADRVVLERFAPPGVLVNAELSIVQFRGHTGPYLEPAPGEASLNVLRMARKGLAFDLRSAIHKAKKSDLPVRVDGISLEDDAAGRPSPRAPAKPRASRRSTPSITMGETPKPPAQPARAVGVEVIPVRVRDGGGPGDRWFLVLFHEQSAVVAPPRVGKGGRERPSSVEVAALERELSATKEYLQATLEEHEATQEELQSANEELISSNEELQSINEELETAKEEQEATNEELSSLNFDFRTRNSELQRVAGDLTNLLSSLDIPVVMLGSNLAIRRFTPPAERVLRLIPSDVGRPIGDLNPRLEVPDLERLLTEVIDAGTVREREVRDRDGRWYSMRLRPYRGADDRIDGAVIVLVDLDRHRRAHNGDGAPVGRDGGDPQTPGPAGRDGGGHQTRLDGGDPQARRDGGDPQTPGPAGREEA